MELTVFLHQSLGTLHTIAAANNFDNKPSNLMYQMQPKLITSDTGNKNTSSLLQIVLLDSVVTKTPFELEAGLLQNNNLTTVLELFYRNDIHNTYTCLY